jgi:hypothetical protein
MSTRIDVDALLAVIEPDHIIGPLGLDAVEHGDDEWRLRMCPYCGASAARSRQPAAWGAAIYRRRTDSRWSCTHHGHRGCSGSLLDVIAAVEKIDRRTEFRKLLERAADLVGSVNSDELQQRRIAADNERARIDRERAAAMVAIPKVWESLHRNTVIGAEYLRDVRGFDADELRAQGVVRYTITGYVAVPMRSLDTGAIVGIQYRAPSAESKDFRTENHSDASSSALVGRLAELDRDGVDVAVIVEGLADTLAARLAFPGCAVFGAAGAGHYATIADAVARRVREVGGWLLLVVDNDETGKDNACRALAAAEAVGLKFDRDLHLVDLGEHHDLADAWKAGWRWSWDRLLGRAS